MNKRTCPYCGETLPIEKQGLLLCIGGIVQLGVQRALVFMEKFKKD